MLDCKEIGQVFQGLGLENELNRLLFQLESKTSIIYFRRWEKLSGVMSLVTYFEAEVD